MRRWRRWSDGPAERQVADERGSASLEFLTAGILLLVPLVYVVLALAAAQAGTFAVEGAARHAARVAVLAGDHASARDAAERSARQTLIDADLDAGVAAIVVSCTPADACTAPSARVRVEVATAIPLPLVPDLFGLKLGTVRVEGVATQTVSKYVAAR